MTVDELCLALRQVSACGQGHLKIRSAVAYNGRVEAAVVGDALEFDDDSFVELWLHGD